MDREELREKIEATIAITLEKISELEELTQPIAPENAIGRVSRMDAINNKAVNEAALLKQQEKLKKLQIALSQVDLPDFGQCKRCGQTIQEGRIILMPESPYCVRCAARA